MSTPQQYGCSNRLRQLTLGILAVCLILTTANVASAQLTSEHRRDLSELRREVSRASSLARREQFDEAGKKLDEAEKKLNEIAEEAGLDENDRAIAIVKRQIDVQRDKLEKMNDEGGDDAVSFTDDVAPILAENCLGCHDDTASAGLRLDTFAGMRKGGRSGALLVPGSPNRSILALRLIADPPQRMPRNNPALEEEEVNTIAKWIAQGAKYDADDPDRSVAELARTGGMEKPEITVAKPEGDETVSFKDDIAPMFVTFCLGCHSGNNPASGFSVETFEDILIGGVTGPVLVPGKPKESRLFRLTGGLENPRMPNNNNSRITRKNYNDLLTWINEGIKYDAKDPKTPLVDLVPSATEKRLMELQQMSEAEYEEMRKDRAGRHWRRTLTSANPASVQNDTFLVMGNTEPQRLQQVLDWSEEMLPGLKDKVGLQEAPKWKGRLAIYVFKDRYDYDEFNRSIEDRQASDALFGHARVTNEQEDAYVAVLDTGDVNSAQTPQLKWTLSKGLISAALQLRGTTRVDWLSAGFGWALADGDLRDPAFEKSMTQNALTAIRDLDRAERLFQAGTFAPDVTEHVGFLIVRFLMSSGSKGQLLRFAGDLRDGRNIEEACRAAYRITPEDLVKSMMASLR